MKLEDRVDLISATIQELRQTSADGPKSRQLIDALFRTVHSFKAAASAEGRNDLSRTAHDFEDLLHALRTGSLTLDDELLHAFAETVAAFRDGSQPSTLNRLNEITREAPARENELPAEFAWLKDDERYRATEALREGANLYVMHAEFDVSDFDERFRQLKKLLEQDAEVISTSPRMESDKIIFQVVYADRSEKIPVQTLLQQAVLAGRSIAAKLEKQVDFVVSSEEVLLSKRWADVLADALIHLVRNAVDHGVESAGKVTLATRTSEGTTRVFVTDNGRGIDPAKLPLLFQPGFSTAGEVSEISGRGVGLDAVKNDVEALGGTVNVLSLPGRFTSFVITMPNPSSDA